MHELFRVSIIEGYKKTECWGRWERKGERDEKRGCKLTADLGKKKTKKIYETDRRTIYIYIYSEELTTL